MLKMQSVRLAALLLLCLLTPGKADDGDCHSNSDCKNFENCFIHKCADLRLLCDYPRYCGPNATCVVLNHKASCWCKPGFSGSMGFPCVQQTANKSFERSIDVEGVGQYNLGIQKLNFSLTTLDVGVEITSLHCYVPPGQVYDVTVRLESDGASSSVNLTLNHAGHSPTDGWFNIPISTEDKEILLLPNSEYMITVTHKYDYYLRRRLRTAEVKRPHFILRLPSYPEEPDFCSPMTHIAYRPFTI